MLHYDGRVGDQWPEFVGLQSRVALEVVEEGLFVGVVVRVCVKCAVSFCLDPSFDALVQGRDSQGCFIQSNFFHVPFPLR